MLTYETILAGVDFTPLSEIGVSAAVTVANHTKAKRLHLVHVLQHYPAWSGSYYPYADNTLMFVWDHTRREANVKLQAVEAAPETARVTRELCLGAPAQEIAKTAATVQADLIVVATHGRTGVKRAVLGSVASTLVRAAPCPVLVVGEDRPSRGPFRRILAAIDLSPISEKVLRHAMGMAAPHHGSVRVLSLFEMPSLVQDDVLPRYMTPAEAGQFPAKHRASVTALADRIRVPEVDVKIDVMSKGPPSRVLLEVAAMIEPDLIVVGTSGHNAWHRLFLGSTATHVTSEAPCPVLVVPHDAPRPLVTETEESHENPHAI